MNYIIFDLEWNSTRVSNRRPLNEIIEIGAVKMSEAFAVTDTFSCLVRPNVSKGLSPFCIDTTHIEIDELNKKGISFFSALKKFSAWCGNENNNIFLSWSKSDLYTLAQNMKFFKHNADIPFIRKYIDAQQFCEQFIDSYDGAHSISLYNTAQYFNISANEENLHRALADSMLAAKCFAAAFDSEKAAFALIDCSGEYFSRLIYKTYSISKPVSSLYNINNEQFVCPACAGKLEIQGKFSYRLKCFHAACICKNCKKKFIVHVNVKKTYDGVSVTKRISRFKEKAAAD
ncbi:MAG: exonuclease domain-containing protein [Clostridiales bacterium]|nr:exonuclease domain-containing protein [Clostridiales bacterium]